MTDNTELLQLKTIEELERGFLSGTAGASTVPFMENPADDNRLCLTLVAFLPEDLQDAIWKRLCEPLSELDGRQYFYPPESMHVTVQNIRSIKLPPSFDESTIALARKTIADVSGSHNLMKLKLRRLFELPTSLALCAFSDQRYPLLVQGLRDGLQDAGIPDDKRYASGVCFGNSTFCRFVESPSAQFRERVRQLKEIEIGSFVLTNLALITTNAACHGSKTNIIERFNLGINLRCSELQHGTEAYRETIELRDKILRKPLGLSFDPNDLAQENDSIHLSVHSDDILLACLVLKPLADGVIQMRQVAVDSATQGRGVGKKLVRFAEDVCRKKGFKKIYLHARETAIPFYLSLAYKIDGEPYTEVGLPHSSMYKELD